MSGGGRDTSVSAPSSDTFPWDMDTPTKQTATEVLQHLIDTALDDPAEDPAAAQNPPAAQDPTEDGWFIDVELEGADLLADDPSQHRVGKAPRAGRAFSELHFARGANLQHVYLEFTYDRVRNAAHGSTECSPVRKSTEPKSASQCLPQFY